MTYSVKEIFLTLQGEGGQAGKAAVFCRLLAGRVARISGDEDDLLFHSAFSMGNVQHGESNSSDAGDGSDG